MATILIIAGLLLVFGGGIVLFLPPPKPDPSAQGLTGDWAKVLEQVNAMFDKFDKRYRPGMLLMLVGLALVGLGVFLESKDAKNAVDAVEVGAMLSGFSRF
jgi:uncharacterized membrane protein